MKKLILLHGALGAAENFNALVASLQNHYECITIDLPGHGANDENAQFSIEYFSEYVIQFVKKNFSEPVSVFGYSMGGYIALNALASCSDLFDKVMTLATKFDWNPAEGTNQMKMLNAEKIQEKVPQYANYLSNLHSAHDWKHVMANTVKLIEKLSQNPPITEDVIRSFENKIRFCVGDKDNMVSIEETMRQYRICKNASFCVLPDTLHPIEKVNVDLLSFNLKNFF